MWRLPPRDRCLQELDLSSLTVAGPTTEPLLMCHLEFFKHRPSKGPQELLADFGGSLWRASYSVGGSLSSLTHGGQADKTLSESHLLAAVWAAFRCLSQGLQGKKQTARQTPHLPREHSCDVGCVEETCASVEKCAFAVQHAFLADRTLTFYELFYRSASRR